MEYSSPGPPQNENDGKGGQSCRPLFLQVNNRNHKPHSRNSSTVDLCCHSNSSNCYPQVKSPCTECTLSFLVWNLAGLPTTIWISWSVAMENVRSRICCSYIDPSTHCSVSCSHHKKTPIETWLCSESKIQK